MNLRDVQAATTDQTLSLGELSTDRRGRYMPEPAPLDPQMASLFRRAGLEAGQSYSLSELEQRMSAAQFDVENAWR